MTTFLLPEDGSDRILGFDATTSENHEFVSTVTDHPVETGVAISDHIRSQPDRLSLELFMSNHPIYVNPLTQRGEVVNVELEIPEYFPSPEALLTSPGGALRFGAGALGDAIGDLLGLQPELKAQLLVFPDVFNAVAERLVELRELRDNAVLMTVLTSVFFYEDMVIERVSVPRVGGNSGATFQVDLRQMNVVESGSVAAPPIPVQPRGVPESAKGAQGAKAPDAGESAEKTKSILLNGLQSLGVGI